MFCLRFSKLITTQSSETKNIYKQIIRLETFVRNEWKQNQSTQKSTFRFNQIGQKTIRLRRRSHQRKHTNEMF